MYTYLNFDHKKATQGLNFFAIKEGGKINKMKALKLIYFADRYHLRKFGRLITNDEYFAMSYGPVASGVKDIAEFSEFLGPSEKDYALKNIEAFDKYHLRSINSFDSNVLSHSDIEALDFSWKTFGHYDQFELAEITHEYPEWNKHENNLELNSRIRMNIEDFLDDPTSNVDKCFEIEEEDKKNIREQLGELSQIESFWS